MTKETKLGGCGLAVVAALLSGCGETQAGDGPRGPCRFLASQGHSLGYVTVTCADAGGVVWVHEPVSGRWLRTGAVLPAATGGGK